MVLRSAVHTTPRKRRADKGACPEFDLPPSLRREAHLFYDRRRYDLSGAVVRMLQRAGSATGGAFLPLVAPEEGCGDSSSSTTTTTSSSSSSC